MAKQESSPAAAPASGLTPVRALVTVHLDGQSYPPDSVIELTAEQLATFVGIGAVDPHPDAVAYARSIAG